MDVILETYYILLPIIATALIGWLGKILSDEKKERKARQEHVDKREKEIALTRKANSEGIKLVLRYMLKRYHTEYILQGKVSYDQFKDWVDIYDAYGSLHGNSIAETWNKDIHALPQVASIGEMTPFESMLRQTLENQQK